IGGECLMLNKIHHGDCLEIMKDIPTGSVDMILCDLPYEVTDLKWDKIIPLEKLWEEYERDIKDKGAIGLTAIETFASVLTSSKINKYRPEWILNKEVAADFIQAKNQPIIVHEKVLVLSKNKVAYNPIMTEAVPENIRPSATNKQKTNFLGKVGMGEFKVSKGYNPQKRYPKSIITYNGRKGDCNNVKRVHPTQKPVPLFEYLINTYTQEGEIILDNCIGSGTTAIASINTNRNYIGIEKEKEYVDIANERINNH